jgi:hypothetical protein
VENEYARWAVSASILVIGELEKWKKWGVAVYSGVSVRQPALGGVVRSFARLLFASTPLQVFALQMVRLSDENWGIPETSRQCIDALVVRCPEAKRVLWRREASVMWRSKEAVKLRTWRRWWCGTDFDIPVVRKSTR